MYCGKLETFLQRKFLNRRISLQPADSWLPPDTDALQLDTGFGTLGGHGVPIHVVLGEIYLGARQATILSKRGSPRRGSQNGSNFNCP